MTRRQRLLGLTGGLGLLFLVVAAIVVWRMFRPGSRYRPGGRVEGLTAELARSLPTNYPRVSFTDVTRTSGISFRHFSGTRSSQLPEDMGSGAAWGDFDNDGWVDLVVANEVGPLSLSDSARAQSSARTTLYHNNHDGTFTDVTSRSGIDVRGWGMAVAWGDVDNDGWIDLVITAYGHCVLYRNNGDGTFTDRSAASGIGGPQGFWTGAAWGDYDRDGFLDLYVTGYVKYARPDRRTSVVRYTVENPASINPLSFPPERNLLFHNTGHGTFTEVASSLGVANPTGRGLAAAWVDIDEDGWPDLYVANDVSDNVMYRNLGNGTFEDISQRAHVADYRSAMGIAVGDWDGDGDQDLFLTHWLAQENALYDNQLSQLSAEARKSRPLPLTFIDEADRFGLGQISLDYVGWGTSFIDYDNDGRPDLFAVNGSTLQYPEDSTHLVPMRSQMFWNRGATDGFFDVSAVSGAYFRTAYVGRGAAFADYDNDGDIDVFVVNNGGPGILLRNDGGNRNHWLAVELRGTKSNRQGIGAKLRLVAGGVGQSRQVGAQASYLSQNSLVETFGLLALTRVDSLVVVWPSGVRQVRTDLPANQRLTVVEGEAVGTARERIQDFWALYREATVQRTARQPKAAAETYSRALALNPDHEDVLYYLGSMRFALGDFTAAEHAWRHLLVRNSSSARTHSQLGSLYLCFDTNAPFQLDSAEAHLRRAHELNGEETGPQLHLGEVALVRGDLATASRYFNEVLGSHANSAEAHFYAGYIAWKRGDRAGALTAIRLAASTAPLVAAAIPGEGDTKSGSAPMRADRLRCGQLDAMTGGLRGADVGREMPVRYRTLDSLLISARQRAR